MNTEPEAEAKAGPRLFTAEQIREINRQFAEVTKAAADAFASLSRELRITQAMAHGRAAGTTAGMKKLAAVLEVLNDDDLNAVRSAANHLDRAVRRELECRRAEREKAS